MFKADLEAAGIAYVDDAGRFCDFHSLRHSTASLLVASGAHPKVCQTLMRHSDINLILGRYSHLFRGQESEAMAQLPDLSAPSSERQRALATGTDGRKNQPKRFAICLATKGVFDRNPVDSNGQPTPHSDSKTPFSPSPRGLEPLTFGSGGQRSIH